MNTIKIALLSWLILLGNMAFADQLSLSPTAPKLGGGAAAPLTLGVLSGASPSTEFPNNVDPNQVFTMTPIRVAWSHYPRYSEIASASIKPGLLEPCALVKADVKATRRFDLFLAPVALDNGAAGFGIVRMSW
jgi:hypothetical protein